MDAGGPNRGARAPSLSALRALLVIVVFAAATVVLVDVGTRPSVSSPATGTAASTTTTAPHHKPSTSSTTTTTEPHSSVSVVVANATDVNGVAAHYSSVIAAGGWSMQTPVDATATEATSSVYYAPGQQEAAASIATTIGVKPSEVLPVSSATPVSGISGTDVVVVIGQDLATAPGA